MLPAAHEKSAGNIEYRALAREARIDLVAGDARAGRELEGVVAGIGAERDEPGGEMERVLPLTLQFHMPERGLVADSDLGRRVALKAADPEAAIALHERG